MRNSSSVIFVSDPFHISKIKFFRKSIFSIFSSACVMLKGFMVMGFSSV